MTLRTDDHDRGAAGLEYVYPVVSRRAEGVSVGINLNPNQACNWRCVYCQVPGLVRGKAPDIDLARLGEELRGFRGGIARGFWLERNVPEGSRRLSDVAFSGDGEPTSSPVFAEAVALARGVLEELGLAESLREVMLDRAEAGLAARLVLAPHVDLRRGILADQHRRESRHDPSRGLQLCGAVADLRA